MTHAVTQTGLQAGAQRSRRTSRPQAPRRPRPVGPYLQRRGRIFYFRKRLRHVIAEKCGRAFLRVSLRTPLLSEAMSRAARLLAVLDGEETRLMTDRELQTFPAEKIGLTLAELLRAELTRILEEQASAATSDDAQIDARIAALEAQHAQLRRQARRNDFASVHKNLDAAAESLGLAVPAPMPVELGRCAIKLAQDTNAVEQQVLDGENLHMAAAPLVAQHSDLRPRDFIRTQAVTLQAAWDRALELYPSRDMKGNIDAIAKLAIDWFGGRPVASIKRDDQEAFFLWMARLPKTPGKRHGMNRFCREAPKDPTLYTSSKQDEIDAADFADEEVMTEIRALDHISDVEKRALLSERLTPRLSLTTIKRNRDGLNRLCKAAADLGCPDCAALPADRAPGHVLRLAGSPSCPRHAAQDPHALDRGAYASRLLPPYRTRLRSC